MHKNQISRPTFSLKMALLSAGLLFFSGPAHAGFQWVAPSDPAAPPAPSVELPAPQIIQGSSPEVAIGASPALPSPSSMPAVSAPPVGEDQIVQGFADRVPLSVALRQVLPEQVGFSVAQDVSLGTLVSWKGGASWRSVMRDMLAPAGLAFKEQGKLVQIVHGDVATAASMPPMASRDVASPSRLPSSQSLPVYSVPDRNMPGGKGGILGGPVTETAPVPATTAPVPLSPAATMTSPYILDRSVSAWTVNQGTSLQNALEDWCKRANVELSWQAEYDYPVQASVSLSGSFEEAVRALLAGFQEANPQPVGYLYNNQVAGQTVLVIQVRGNNYNQ
jgi:hypothetical protein